MVPVGLTSRRNGGVDMCHGERLDGWSQQGSEAHCRCGSGRSAGVERLCRKDCEAHKLNKEDVMDRSRWKKLIKDD